MLVKIAAFLKNDKLINYTMIFGLTALGMIFVTVIAWSDRLMKKIKIRRRASGKHADTLAMEEDAAQ